MGGDFFPIGNPIFYFSICIKSCSLNIFSFLKFSGVGVSPVINLKQVFMIFCILLIVL